MFTRLPRRGQYLLWVDCAPAAIVGASLLFATDWLAHWYALPRDFLRLMGTANLAYACYSLSLAIRSVRPMVLVALLVVANLGWAALCLGWAVLFRNVASPFGLLHLFGEGLFVGCLGLLEWRSRKLLTRATV